MDAGRIRQPTVQLGKRCLEQAGEHGRGGCRIGQNEQQATPIERKPGEVEGHDVRRPQHQSRDGHVPHGKDIHSATPNPACLQVAGKEPGQQHGEGRGQEGKGQGMEDGVPGALAQGYPAATQGRMGDGPQGKQQCQQPQTEIQAGQDPTLSPLGRRWTAVAGLAMDQHCPKTTLQ